MQSTSRALNRFRFRVLLFGAVVAAVATAVTQCAHAPLLRVFGGCFVSPVVAAGKESKGASDFAGSETTGIATVGTLAIAVVVAGLGLFRIVPICLANESHNSLNR